MSKSPSSSSRRDFLTGKVLLDHAEQAGDVLADRLAEGTADRSPPAGGDTLRLTTDAMACTFCVIVNPGPTEQIRAASHGLDVIHVLEDQMTVYRSDSQLSRLNRQAASGPVRVEPDLFDLLDEARRIAVGTDRAFDPTSGPLIALWRTCRSDGRIPAQEEIESCLERTGIGHVQFDSAAKTVRFDREGIELNLGGIGKGYALDRAAETLVAHGLDEWLFHGGHSSMIARGDHNRQGGWPVGIRNPLFTEQRLATILLQDCAFSTSGSNIQYFRHKGRRYGHILDPRTGWPAEGLLSAGVIAPTAAEADALSTAFFVLGVEIARQYCDNNREVGAILIPPPRQGRTLEPVVCGISEDVLFFEAGSR